jgi:hypothetical protein
LRLQLFYVDWSDEYEAGALKAAPLSVLEVPTGFFFLGRDKVLRPLAIKFRVGDAVCICHGVAELRSHVLVAGLPLP